MFAFLGFLDLVYLQNVNAIKIWGLSFFLYIFN